MPIYVYQAREQEKSCEYCRTSFELLQSMSEESLSVCPKCGAAVRRLIQLVGMRVGQRHLLTDKNIKDHGFTKLVNEGGGKYRKI
jgi:putative FmdB family regulatory protein